MNRRFSLAAVLLIGAMVAPVWAADSALDEQYQATIEKLLPGMGAPAIPDRKESQQALEKLCHELGTPGKDAEREALCKAMIAKVGPETAKPARVWILRKLDPLGREEVVAGLRELLHDPDTEIRDLARRALANNPSPQAASVLRLELTATNEPAWQVALINALGWRGEAESEPAIAKLARSTDASVAAAAVAALGDIADDSAVRTLAALRKSAPAPVRATVVDSSLRAADKLRNQSKADAAAKIYESLLAASEPEHIRIAAMTGLAAARGSASAPRLIEFVSGDDAHLQLIAARCLQRLDEQATPAIVKAMPAARPQTRALLLEALGEHGDSAALSAVAQQATDNDAEVRIAALGAIGKLGDGSMVQLLIERGVKGESEEREAARRSLAVLRGKDVDDVVLKALGEAKGAERIELLYAVWGRRIAAAKPMLLAAASEPDESARLAALTALERLAGPTDLGALVSVLSAADGQSTRKAAEEAITSVCRRVGDDDRCAAALTAGLEKAPPAGQVALIGILAQVQGGAALPAVRAAAKSEDAAVRKAADDALAHWKPVFINAWQASGPYRQEGKGAAELFDIAFPPEDSQTSPQWKPLKANRGDRPGIFDLHRLGKGDNCCAYAKATIISERPQDVVLTLGSDDGVKVWLNGNVVHAKNVTRALNCGEDQVKVTLKQGENALLLKVTQGGADWSFCCGVQSPEGGPADGLKFEAK